MMKIPKPVWIVAGIAALAGAGFWILRPDPVRVDVATVTRGPLQVTVDEDGETRVEDRYVVSSPVTGRMVRLECEVGDPVEAGQVLARIYPLPLDTRTRAETARLSSRGGLCTHSLGFASSSPLSFSMRICLRAVT